MKPEAIITPGNVRAFPRARRVQFPHMGPADTRVWRASLELGLARADRFEYDVRLGGALADLVEDGHEHKPMWETLLRKRIDVVAWTGQQPTIIEVKPVGSFAALGQVLGYGQLWEEERPGGLKPGLCVVCGFSDPDLISTYERYGVALVSLPSALAESLLEVSQRVAD